MIWKDASSYSRGEVHGGDNATVWEVKAGTLRIAVHRWVGDPTGWYLSCDELGISKRYLDSKYLKVAARDALAIVRAETKRLAALARLTTKATWEDFDA